ncbi:reverse transcriptase [Plakobranchus ocellatus]|uniref:Reverse transcriptase n=1 Tax=Plakobranchus ocellatus TaxID=259542 RepID=A0AAV3ZRJ6_9GAST|nr:reverse transcriptase [Plakobranchus ocellatus]
MPEKAFCLDEKFRELLIAKRQKIHFPPTSEVKQWEELVSKIFLKLDELLGKSTLEHDLATFGDIVNQKCLATLGAKQYRIRAHPRKSRRQREMQMLRKQKRDLKKQMKAAPVEERTGLRALWRDLKAKQSVLSRAESARKRRSQKKRTPEYFFKDPFQIVRHLFQQSRSDTLTAQKEELEAYLRKIYSDPERERPLEDVEGLVWPSAPGVKFNSKPPTLCRENSID